MTNDDKIGREFEELIEGRIGQEFDDQCILSGQEARAVVDLIRASRTVFAGLNARIVAADDSSVPVFGGIAALNDALRVFEPEETAARPAQIPSQSREIQYEP